jgi:diguanylate cyclase (GGDEF)-like protein
VELAVDTVREPVLTGPDSVTGQPPRPVRRWGALVDRDGWVVLVAAMYTAAFVAWVIVAGGNDRTSTVISDYAFLPAGLAAGLVAWRAAAHPALDRATRKAWRLIGLSFFAWWFGDVVWFWFEVVRHSSPFPSLADAGYLSFYPLLLWGLLTLPGAPRAALDRMKVWLDAGTVLLGGTMAVWYVVIQPTVAEHESHLLNKVLSVAYPVGDLVVVFGLAMMLLRRPASASVAALRLLVVGASVFVVADVTYARLNLSNSYNGPGVPDIFWMIALFFMLAGAASQRRRAATPSELVDDELGPARVSKLPYLALAVGYGFMLWVGHRQAVSPLNGLLIGAVGLTVLVAARQMTAQQENLKLTATLAQLATVDVLTGLRNRRSFFELAEREWTRALRSDSPLSAVMVDVDRFKRINDSLGHAAGDEVLSAVSRRCLEELRSIDVLGRYGGDELVALLPDSAIVDALAVAQRLRLAVASTPVPTENGDVRVCISVGVATAAGGCASLRKLLGQADTALYQAKHRGRDQVQAWYPGMALTPP